MQVFRFVTPASAIPKSVHTPAMVTTIPKSVYRPARVSRFVTVATNQMEIHTEKCP